MPTVLTVNEFADGIDLSIIAPTFTLGNTKLRTVFTDGVGVVTFEKGLFLLKLSGQQAAIYEFSSDDFNNIAIAISFDDLAIQGIDLQGFLPGKDKNVASDDQMFHRSR